MDKSFWQGRPVLVTGATGLLGGWMVRGLRAQGAQVVALVRDSVPGSMFSRDGTLNDIPTVHGGLTDMGLVRRTFAEYGIKTVMHLAAQTLVGVAKADPIGTLEANIQGTWTILDAARQMKGVQVLVASSDKAYGEAVSLPYTEDQPLRGKYPYDVSKSCVDLLAGMYAHTYKLPVGIVRCGNLYGGGDLNFSRLIPGMIRATVMEEAFLIRSDGKFVRDYLYAEDAVDAYMTFAEKMAQDESLYGEAFNFSLEVRYTVLDLVKIVQDLVGGSKVAPVVQNIASDEIREQYMTSDKARKLLGWTPRCGMDQGLRRTIDWYRAHLAREMETRPAHV